MQNFQVKDIVRYKFGDGFYYFEDYHTVDLVTVRHIFTGETKVVKERSITMAPEYIFTLVNMVEENYITKDMFENLAGLGGSCIGQTELNNIMVGLQKYCIDAEPDEVNDECDRILHLSNGGPEALSAFLRDYKYTGDNLK